MMSVELTDYQDRRTTHETWPHLTCEDFADRLAALTNRRGCFILELNADEEKVLLIGIDRADQIATYIAGEPPYDLLGDSTREGVREFNLGGQVIDNYPARFIVPLGKVADIACGFLVNEDIDVSTGDWIAQGEFGW
jgi:hypothetical protein